MACSVVKLIFTCGRSTFVPSAVEMAPLETFAMHRVDGDAKKLFSVSDLNVPHINTTFKDHALEETCGRSDFR